MHAFYFGKSEQPLYGVSHAPSGNGYQNSAVLICNAIGHEYIRSHRALKQLADKLSLLGYYVLRFDYTGVGDSSGTFSNVSTATWRDDIKQASEELKAISGAQTITAIGVRMGATLLLETSAAYNFNQVIMWDPIVSGEQYIENLKNLHKKLLVDRMWFNSTRSEDDMLEHEYLGYQYAGEVINDIQQMNLLEVNISEYQNIVTLNTESEKVENLDAWLNDKLDEYQSLSIDDPCNWNELDFIDSSLSSLKIVDHICELLK